MKSETIKLAAELENEFLKKTGTGFQVSIFLCGGGGKQEGELRRAIGTRIVDLTSKYAYAVHYPEDLFVELMQGHQKHDLLSLENILANSVHAVAIILHSPGTFAELGAFSNHPILSQKLVIVTDPKYRNRRSFINLGPIRYLRTKTHSKILYLNLESENLDNLSTAIAEASREIARTSSPKHDLTNPLAAYQFFLAAIHVFDPIPKVALMNLVDSLRPGDGRLVRTVGETVVNSLINERKVFYNGVDLSITREGMNDLILSGRTKNRIKARSAFLSEIRVQALNLCLRKYVKNKNLIHNVSPHSANRYFLCLDLEDFFPSISDGRVRNILRLIGYSWRASYFLSALCSCDGGLPQGAVTSPALSNLAAAKLDRRIAGFTSRRNIVFTRYADDITLSSNNPAALSRALPTVMRIIRNERFKVNEEKTRMVGPRRQCRITGLTKNTDEPRFGIGKRKKHQMRAIMHNLLMKGKTDQKYDSAESILGWLSFLKGVDRVSYEQMNRTWEMLLAKSTPPPAA